VIQKPNVPSVRARENASPVKVQEKYRGMTEPCAIVTSVKAAVTARPAAAAAGYKLRSLKMKNKQSFAVLPVLLLAFSMVLAGCDNDTNNGGGTDSGGGETDTTNPFADTIWRGGGDWHGASGTENTPTTWTLSFHADDVTIYMPGISYSETASYRCTNTSESDTVAQIADGQSRARWNRNSSPAKLFLYLTSNDKTYWFEKD
jgi:predicted small secreted protein